MNNEKTNKEITTCKVLINTVNKAKEFVAAINKCPFETDIGSDTHIVDAKSIMGLFSLNISQPVTLQIHCSERDAALTIADLREYIVA